MELTEQERLFLVEKKDEILKLTEEILDCYQDEERWCEIEIKINHVISLLSTIGSFSKSDRDLNAFTKLGLLIVGYGNLGHYHYLRTHISGFCLAANSVQFEFTKSGIKLYIPKIDLNLIKN